MGYFTIDLFSTNNSGANVTVAGDVMDIALIAIVSSVDEAYAALAREIGSDYKFPYNAYIQNVYVNGVEYKDTTVMPNGQSSASKPIVIDLGGVNAPAGANAATVLKLGLGWAVTRGGWDYFYCRITCESGKTGSVFVSDGVDFAADSGTLNNSLKPNYQNAYGADFAKGGNLMSKFNPVDLTGFEGEVVNIEFIGVSNYGAEYTLATVSGFAVPGTLAYEIEDELYGFVDDSVASKIQIADLKGGDVYGISITVPEGEQASSIKIGLSNDNTKKSYCVEVSVYTFTGNYSSDVAKTPIFTYAVTSGYRWVSIPVAKGKMPAGNYLVVVKYSSAISGSVATVMLDNAKTAGSNIVGYKNGEESTTLILCGALETEKVSAAKVPADETINASFSENDAKVIVIAGQSNACGATSSSILKNNISAEEYAKYQNGFPNVKILYKNALVESTGINVKSESDGFVDVVLGQGIYSWTFGPELALAAYLAENYPDETFYIIKYAVGSSAMDLHWNAQNSGARYCLDQLEQTVDTGLATLEAAGLSPKIVGFIWMQGEGDANTAYRVSPYYANQTALMSELREEYSEYSVDGGDIAFIDTEISDSGIWTASYLVNAAKKDIAEDSARNYIIDSNYYGVTALYENNDPAHYDSTSMLLLGQLYAKKLCSIYSF